MTKIAANIILDGHVDDLYALSLLFPEGAHPNFHIVTQLVGAKDGMYDRVLNVEHRHTYLTGDGCLPLVEASGVQEMGWVAHEIMAPLNGYAALADSNYEPVVPVSVSWEGGGCFGGATFGSTIRKSGTISANRHDLIRQLMFSRVDFMIRNPLAAYAAAVIAGQPSWADYYRLLEDIAGHRGTTLDKLTKIGIAKRQSLDGFKMAANNRMYGRHGASKRDARIQQKDLMNLTEAREFVRSVVTAWLDQECGGRLPRDRVDGGILRFGLDGENH
ncbi:hypothetical protein ACYZUD_05715 [Pseudomonas sp. XS1P51]